MDNAELKDLPEGVRRVTALLRDQGHPHRPVLLNDAVRTAQQAADALGILVGQIAKSIIFRRKSDDVAVLVVTSGDRRVDEKKVEALVGKIGRADADFVKRCTGFSIGGVAPVAHATKGVTLIDRDLFRFEEIWAAAGHPHGVFKLHPRDLESLTHAPVVDIVQGSEQAPASMVTSIILARACLARDANLAVPSPCTSVCRMDDASGWCAGCFRSIEEITNWSRMAPPEQRVVWGLIEQRAKQPTIS
ncbi:MAG: YbaK/EbsC family protein [Rhodoferax sp.]|nr:YbaK/EbsC family protein [Rhodoferax sp.]